MAFNSIEELLEDYRQGKMVLLVDDEDRENEGDLLIAAERCDAQAINFMARERAWPDLPDPDRRTLPAPGPGADGAGQRQRVQHRVHRVDRSRHGVTTGISAADRARTVAAAMAPMPARRPGAARPHLPLRAREGGVLTRAGHTEAGCDLARLAGFTRPR
jgi:3,4-dihydroxy 2-butanone 4-phosphate synthase/GTP cyclohydrolase II